MLNKKTLIAISISVICSNAYAGAFQLNEHSASGLGRAFAGDAAIADDASIVARNPAGMTKIERAQVSGVVSYISPDVSVTGESAPNGTNASLLNDNSIAPSAIVPAGYFVLPINEQMTLGGGAFSNYGLSTEFDENYPAGQLAGETALTTVNFNISAAYKLTDALSLGAGFNLVYADAHLIRHIGQTPLGLPNNVEAANLSGDDVSFGWNVGALYEVNTENRFGLSYRSQVDLDLKGDYSNQLPAALGGLAGTIVPGELAIALPDIAEFSGYHAVTNTFAIHYSVQWTDWSDFKELAAYVEGKEEAVFSKTEDFSDAYRVAIGATYQLSPTFLVRAGIANDATPTNTAHKSISIPDSDRIWYSAGLSYSPTKQHKIDFAVSFIDGESVTFEEQDDFGQTWGFESHGDASLAAMQYSYTF
ncbi:outer membrane protein transport protein [Pseudoalteromonas sp. SSM20]|uniref:outer membrane protein transport protein n=1 Tax=unclassified Pseudoalteromonas TaxID=194690 RepID=UPI00237E1845|nr:outer membrane protein transport protein [Pseudoalteromonas sp. G4]MDE3270472.1 outer membrane protein transport protein [Pseudoalteromonas sp. G4]